MNAHAEPPDGFDFAFDYPEGQVHLRAAELEDWAEHYAWCLRFFGVGGEGTLVVVDYGTSPVSFLASSLQFPVERGAADRLGVGFVCLDAAHARLALLPEVLGVFAGGTLLLRAGVARLAWDLCRRAGVPLEKAPWRVVIATDGASQAWRPPCAHDELLVHESSLLLAPRCRSCDGHHLRQGHYDWSAGHVRNVRHPDVDTWRAPSGWASRASGCELGAGDRVLDATPRRT